VESGCVTDMTGTFRDSRGQSYDGADAGGRRRAPASLRRLEVRRTADDSGTIITGICSVSRTAQKEKPSPTEPIAVAARSSPSPYRLYAFRLSP